MSRWSSCCIVLKGRSVSVFCRDKAFKDKASKRENTLRGILSFVMTTLWKFLFGKQADGLKKVNESEGFCNVYLNK